MAKKKTVKTAHTNTQAGLKDELLKLKEQMEKFYKDEPVTGLSAEDVLETARLKMYTSVAPFLGNIAQNMPLVEDNRFPTTAVDPKGRLYFNRKWVNSFTHVDALFEFGHEVMHLVQRSFERKPMEADPGLWNKACDYLCDVTLIDWGLEQSAISKEVIGQKEIDLVHKLGTIEKVYQHLLKEAQDEAGQSGCKACQALLGMTQNAQQQEDQQQKKDNQQINQENGNSTEGEGDGEPNAGGGRGHHSHGDGDPCDCPGQGGQPLQHTCGNIRMCCAGTSTSQDISPMDQQKWTEILIAAKMYAESKGNMPGALGEAIDGLTKSTVRWQDYLKTRATKVFGHDRYSYKRYNRRSAAIKVRLPRPIPDGRSAVIAFDTSGSMSDDEVRQCFSEAVEIFRQCGANKLFIILHDAVVYYAGEVASDSLRTLKLGRGGTSHEQVFKVLNGEEVVFPNGSWKLPDNAEVELAILFTDLGTDFPDKKPGFDVLWGVPKGSSPGMGCSIPFGKKVEVDMAANRK